MIVSKKVNAVAFAMDGVSLIIYTDDGNVITFQQGDVNIERLAPILSQKLGVEQLDFCEVGIYAPEEVDIYKTLIKAGARIKEMIDMVTGKPTVSLVNEAEEEIIGKIESAEKILEDAVVNGNTEGATKFLERLAKLTAIRKHSAEDLLRFLRSNELPITVNGDILIFKSVHTKEVYCDEDGKKERVFTDCHTGNVIQRIGDIVKMDESLVDQNRQESCSNGLHLASLNYASSFTGDALLLCLAKPEDIMSVPLDSSGTKIRSSAYKVLAELPSRYFSSLDENDDVNKLIGECVAGWEPETNNIVTIGGKLATSSNVSIVKQGTPVKEAKPKVKASSRKLIDPNKDTKKARMRGKKVDPANIGRKRTIVGETFDLYKAGKATAQDVYDAYRKNKRPWKHHEISDADAKKIVTIVKGK